MTMEDVHPNWKSLPVEILYQIFQFVEQVSFAEETKNLALVCKAWTTPAQTVLYSNVEFEDLLQFKQFCSTVESNSQLGKMVKKLTYSHCEGGYADNKEEELDLMTNLLAYYLPNLEEYKGDALRSYFPLLNALQDTQLKRLKKISSPTFIMEKTEFAMYATCALLLKDRIEDIVISDVEIGEENVSSDTIASTARLYTNRLYRNLHQFEKLTGLNIDRKTNDQIQEIEYILANCKSLKMLSFDFEQLPQQDNSILQRKSVSVSTLTQAPSIKELYCRVEVSNDYKILLYLMKKLTQLKKFYFYAKGDNFIHIDQKLLAQLLNYLSKMECFEVGSLCVNSRFIPTMLGDYWRTTSKAGSEFLSIIYSADPTQGDDCLLGISKEKRIKKTKYTILYPSLIRNSQHVSFMEKNGAYLKKYKFEFRSDRDADRHLLPSDFISQTFTQCPKLQILHIFYCILKQQTHSRMDLRKKSLLQELYLFKCLFYPVVLEHLSMSISEIKLLRIGGLFCVNDILTQPPGIDISPGDPNLEILMPPTDVSCVSIENVYDRTLHLKVFAVNQGEYYYYKYCDRNLQASNEQEHANFNGGAHIYLCFKSNPTIKID